MSNISLKMAPRGSKHVAG